MESGKAVWDGSNEAVADDVSADCDAGTQV